MDNKTFVGSDIRHIWRRVEESVPVVLLFVMPIVLPFARRAGPVTLSLAGIFAISCMWQSSELRSRLLRFHPLAFCLALFFVWSGITLLWSPWFCRGLVSLLSGIEIVFVAALVLALPVKTAKSRLYLFAASGLAVGSALVLADLHLGAPLLKALNDRPDPFRYNMVLVSFIPASIALVPVRLKEPWFLLRILALLLLALAIFSSESEAAKAAILIMYGSFVCALLLPAFLSRWAMLAIIAAAWISAPWLSQELVFGKAFLGSLWEAGHAAERLAIWRGFGEMALAGLPWGWGIDASPVAKLTSFFSQASAETQKNVSWLHPHSIPLQIYVELGLPGVLFGGLTSLMALPRPDHVCRDIWARYCAFVAAVFTVSMISHGFWQTWWWAAIATGAYALKLLHAKDGA